MTESKERRRIVNDSHRETEGEQKASCLVVSCKMLCTCCQRWAVNFWKGHQEMKCFGYFSTLMLHMNKLGLKWRYRVNADCNITAGIVSGRNHPTWNWVSQLVKNINPQLEQGSDYRFVHSYFQLMCLTQVKVTIKIT